MKEFRVDGHEPSYLPEGEWELIWNDEFDGTDLDRSEFHRFGLLWDETGYTYYIDGVEDGKISDYITARPEFILISTEVLGYRFEEHKPVKEAFDAIGDTFVVDHIRVFDKVR